MSQRMSPPPPESESPILQVRRPSRRDEPGAPAGIANFADPLAPPPGRAADPQPASGEMPALPQIDELLTRKLAATNPLVSAALPILTLVCQLRGTLQHDDVPRLQWLVSEQLRAFESAALLNEASPQDVVAARYVLCSLVDETVLSTPWGGQSVWAAQSMLSLFHKETWGGEKVFAILDRIKGKASRYLQLLELIDLCLTLGFRGRYEVLDNGLYQLEELRSEIWRLIANQRGSATRPLAPEFRAERVRRSLVRYVPLWVVFAVMGVVLLAGYGGLQIALSERVGAAATTLDAIAPPG